MNQDHLQVIREDQHLLEENFQRLSSVSHQVEKLVLSAQRRFVEDDEKSKVNPFAVSQKGTDRGSNRFLFTVGVTAANEVVLLSCVVQGLVNNANWTRPDTDGEVGVIAGNRIDEKAGGRPTVYQSRKAGALGRG